MASKSVSIPPLRKKKSARMGHPAFASGLQRPLIAKSAIHPSDEDLSPGTPAMNGAQTTPGKTAAAGKKHFFQGLKPMSLLGG